MIIMSLLQIAALPQYFINSRGNPNGKGWVSLKRARKRAVFKGIIGVPCGTEAKIWPERAWPGFLFGWESGLDDFWYGPEAHAPQILPGVENTYPSSNERQLLQFWGRLGMAGKLALTFQLASKGELGPDRRRKTPGHAYPQDLFSRKRVHVENPGILPWQGKKWRPGDPPPQAVYEDDGEPPWKRKPDDSAAAGEASAPASCTESEENLPGEWPSWSGYRDTDAPFAVIALDPQKGKQLLRLWLETGYLQSADADGREAVGIVAAAVRKGQGLLLTVQEFSWDQYADHTDDKEREYEELYGKLPMDSAYGVFVEDEK
jgi:hypothetical protein